MASRTDLRRMTQRMIQREAKAPLLLGGDALVREAMARAIPVHDPHAGVIGACAAEQIRVARMELWMTDAWGSDSRSVISTYKCARATSNFSTDRKSDGISAPKE